jgi:hypothetical protein
MNYMIYISKDGNDSVPIANRDVYISDWVFTPDSMHFIYIDQFAKKMHFVKLDDLSHIATYKFNSLAGYDTMTIKTPTDHGVAVWEIPHIIYADNQQVVVITQPSQFIVHNFKNGCTRSYTYHGINEAVFVELTGSRLSFVNNSDRSQKYSLDLGPA